MCQFLQINFLLFAFFIFFSSCSSHHYLPENNNQTLSFSQKKEIQISTGTSKVGYREYAESFNFQGGYSPIDNWAITTSYFKSRKNTSRRSIAFGNTAFWSSGQQIYQNLNFSIGYYSNLLLTSSPVEKELFFDAYLGYGRGSIRNLAQAPQGDIFLFFEKKFFNAGLHFRKEDWQIDYQVGLNHIQYNKGVVNGKVPPNLLQEFEETINLPAFFSPETTFRIKYGAKSFMIYSGITITFEKTKQPVFKSASNTYFSSGIIIGVNELFDIFIKKEQP